MATSDIQQEQGTPVIEIHDLRTQFGDFVVHDHLDLCVEPGEIVGLVGGSGSGKTTLLRQILGLNRPAAGTVKVFGQDVNQANSSQMQGLRNRWGMLFQKGALFSALSVFNNVALPMRELRTLPENLIRDAVLLKLQLMGIPPEQANRLPSDLSGGMIKRVALARALAMEPELLFLDEPTAGLDPSLSENFVELIRSLRQQMQLTVVMVTHDLDTLLALSSKIAVLADKKVIAYAAPDEVMAMEHPFIQDFFLGSRGRRALQQRQALNAEPAHTDQAF